MWAFVQRLCSRTIFPVGWTIFTIALLCLPGSDIPSEGWFFSFEHMDKVAHVILFGGIVLFWGFYFRQRPAGGGFGRQLFWSVLLSTTLGIGLEFLQRYAIPHRSFDVGDIWADFGGSVSAAIFHLIYNGVKKRAA